MGKPSACAALLTSLTLTAVTLLSSGCVHDSTTIYHRDAAVVPDGNDFAVVKGTNVVLEVNRFAGRIFADTAKSYALYLEIERGLLNEGKTLSVPSPGAACHVWILDAPHEHGTDACSGSITITAIDERSVTAKVAMRADDGSIRPWTLRETVTFTREVESP